MKKIILFILLIFTIIMLFNCSDKINDPIDEEKLDFKDELHKLLTFNLGSNYNYAVDTLNNNTNLFDNIGQRLMIVEDKIVDSENEIIDCSENYSLVNLFEKKHTRVIFTNNSIEYRVDSSGISSFLADSIDLDLSVTLDERATLVHYPYLENQSWDVFSAFAHFAGSKFKVFSIIGEYEGTENIDIPNFTEAISTEKFKYIGELNLPNINNPFVSNLHTYTAYAWISPEFGIVKLEGFSLFIAPLTGMHFNISDSSKVFRHTLTSIK